MPNASLIHTVSSTTWGRTYKQWDKPSIWTHPCRPQIGEAKKTGWWECLSLPVSGTQSLPLSHPRRKETFLWWIQTHQVVFLRNNRKCMRFPHKDATNHTDSSTVLVSNKGSLGVFKLLLFVSSVLWLCFFLGKQWRPNVAFVLWLIQQQHRIIHKNQVLEFPRQQPIPCWKNKLFSRLCFITRTSLISLSAMLTWTVSSCLSLLVLKWTYLSLVLLTISPFLVFTSFLIFFMFPRGQVLIFLNDSCSVICA